MRLKTILTVAVVVVVVAVGGVIGFLSQLDPNDYRDDITIALQDATGRTVTLGGMLTLEKSMTPTLAVENVTIANASWSKTPEMASIRRLEVEVELLPLLTGVVVVNSLELNGGVILLETDGDGQANWEFASTSTDAGAPQRSRELSFKSISIKDTNLTFRSDTAGTEDSLNIADLELKASDPSQPLEVSGTLELNGAQFKLEGTLKTLATLVEGKNSAVDLTLQSDDLKVTATGTLGDPGTTDFLDLTLSGDLKSGDALAPFGIALGDLVGETTISAALSGSAGKLTFDDLVATSAGSTLKGKTTLDLTGERPLVSGSVTLDTFDLDTLTRKADAEVETTDRVFPATPLPFDGLKTVDLKLDLRVDEFKAQGFTFTSLSSTLDLSDGKLILDPLGFDLLTASVTGSGKADASGPALALSLEADDLDVGALLKTLDASTRLTGTGDVILDISGTGASLADIAGTLDGKASILMENGKLDAHELDLLVGGVTTILGGLFSKGTDTARLNCLALAWDIESGVANQKIMLIDTQYSTVTGTGEIDLGKETLDLKLTPHAKGVTLNLSVPVHVGGTLLKPTFTPDEGALAVRLGGLLGATLFPPAMLLALGDIGSSDGGCTKANEADAASAGGGSGIGGAVEGVVNDVGTAVDDVVKGVGDQIDSLFE